MHVGYLLRASVIHNPGPNPEERENASFRVYPGSPTARHKRVCETRDCDSYIVQVRLRNERVLLFNPLKLFRIMALMPGIPGHESSALNVSCAN